MTAETIVELRRLLEKSTPDEPWIVVRSEAHRSDGTICGQTEIKCFITTNEMLSNNDWIFDTRDGNLAALIVAAVNSLPVLLDRLEKLESAEAELDELRGKLDAIEKEIHALKDPGVIRANIHRILHPAPENR